MAIGQLSSQDSQGLEVDFGSWSCCGSFLIGLGTASTVFPQSFWAVQNLADVCFGVQCVGAWKNYYVVVGLVDITSLIRNSPLFFLVRAFLIRGRPTKPLLP